MNILYISYDGMTDPLGQSQVLPYLQGIAAGGYNITLLSCEKPDRYEKYKADIEAICKSSNINWQPIMYTKRPPVLSTVYDVYKLRTTAEKLHREKNFSLVHCRSYISALIGLHMKRKFGLKFIFDMRGFWADERVEGNLWKLSNPLYKTVYNYFKKKEIQFLEEADYTISLTQNAADEIHTWKSVIKQPVPIQVIPCCADLNLFSSNSVTEQQKDNLRTELKINKEQFVLSYIGSLGTWYMLQEMLDFFNTLLKAKPNAVFLIITNDPGDFIMETARQKNIPAEKIVVTRTVRKQMPLYISISSFSMFFIRPSFSKKASSPVKQGEVMGMGIPIVCNSNIGDTDTIIKTSNAGIIINNFDTKIYENAVQQLISYQPDTTSIIGGAQQYYSLEKGVEKYLSVYRKLLG